jgi:hypothetical protein
MTEQKYIEGIQAIERHFDRKFRPGVVETAWPAFEPYPLDAIRSAYQQIKQNWNQLPPINRILEVVDRTHNIQLRQQTLEREQQNNADKKLSDRETRAVYQATTSSPLAKICTELIAKFTSGKLDREAFKAALAEAETNHPPREGQP